MAIDKEVKAKILRYHFVEKWRTGTIATQLGIHHSVIGWWVKFVVKHECRH